MPAKKQGPLLTVAELFGKCQETTGSHSKYARILWELEAADSEGCFEELYRCLSYLLTVPLVRDAAPACSVLQPGTLHAELRGMTAADACEG